MSEYTQRLSALATRKSRLAQEEAQLLNRRKQEVAQLAHRFKLLAASDRLLAGVFSEIEKALQTNDARVKQWESAGTRLLKAKTAPTTAPKAATPKPATPTKSSPTSHKPAAKPAATPPKKPAPKVAQKTPITTTASPGKSTVSSS